MEMFNLNPNISNNINTTSVAGKGVLLVIDWSNLMFRSLFLHKLFNGSTSGYDRIEDIKSFCYKFATDICSLVKLVKPVHTIICKDSQEAWRKEILPGPDGYKGNREKDPNINWENIYKCSDELVNILNKNGFSVVTVEHAEADDMIACVKEVVFAEFPQYNMIIVSADGDMRQLIEYDSVTGQYCIVYNPTAKPNTKKRHMYVTQSFKDYLTAPEVCDIFFTGYEMNSTKQYIFALLKANADIEIVVENPEEVLLNKIMCGDDSDNVPSFYSFYKNDRLTRVTAKRSEKMLSLIGATNVKQLTESIDKLSDAMKTVFKVPEVYVDCRERLGRQRKLVELKSEQFPEHIREYKETISYILHNMVPRKFSGINVDDILRGTPYEGANEKKALEADVFRDLLKQTTKMPKPVTAADIPNIKVINQENGYKSNNIFDVNGLF